LTNGNRVTFSIENVAKIRQELVQGSRLKGGLSITTSDVCLLLLNYRSVAREQQKTTGGVDATGRNLLQYSVLRTEYSEYVPTGSLV
jgi:hypothetical protein